MKRVSSLIATLVFFGFGVYLGIPRYREFDQGVFSMNDNEYYYYELVSEGDAPLKVELEESSGSRTFDAYLMDETQFQVVEEWMASDDIEQPEVNYMEQWENVSQVTQEAIIIPEGTFYLVVDNTELGQVYEAGQGIDVNYKFSEKY